VYEKRDRNLYLRLSETELSAAEAAADSEGITIQQWIRFALRRLLGLSAPGAPKSH
jgi:predicted DNA binding CopG/RHH family protein